MYISSENLLNIGVINRYVDIDSIYNPYKKDKLYCASLTYNNKYYTKKYVTLLCLLDTSVNYYGIHSIKPEDFTVDTILQKNYRIPYNVTPVISHRIEDMFKYFESNNLKILQDLEVIIAFFDIVDITEGNKNICRVNLENNKMLDDVGVLTENIFSVKYQKEPDRVISITNGDFWKCVNCILDIKKRYFTYGDTADSEKLYIEMKENP